LAVILNIFILVDNLWICGYVDMWITPPMNGVHNIVLVIDTSNNGASVPATGITAPRPS